MSERSARVERALDWVVRLGLAGMFAYAGATKLGSAAELARDIVNYRVVPEPVAAWGSLFLPVLELVLAAGLCIPGHVRGAAALGAGLLVVFAAAMAQAKLRGIDLACGCFGGNSQVSWFKVAVDLALAGVAAWLVVRHSSRPARLAIESGGAKA